MLLRFPASLHYPITVTELLKQPNDNVERFAPLFSYFYKTTVTEGDELGNEHQVERNFPTRFESNVEGKLMQWKIKKGALISNPHVEMVEIEEPCSHSVQFGGLCANCGKDMGELAYNTEQLDSTRATINMDHNNVSLTISHAEAAKAEDEAKRRLLTSRKLSLVVDVDMTIIHATVEQTVGEWQKDEGNPNHDAVKDVRSFVLKDDGPERKSTCYYIKVRPGLQEFLENVSKCYELHIYTMATRAYVKNIVEIIDPDHKYFGDRILSRDESGSMHAKNLQRLFPVDTKMVLIIDDRADVWKWSPNLVKVTPYNFFVGAGDINSSFLPQKPKPGPKLASKAPGAALKQIPNSAEGADSNDSKPTTNGDAAHSSETSFSEGTESSSNSNVSPFEQLVAMGGGDDAGTLQAQTVAHDEALAVQLEERPLLQKQRKLEAEDAATEAAAAKEDNDSSDSTPFTDVPADSSQHDRPKHNLLQDHDRELYQLGPGLRKVQTEFFNIYRSELATAQGGRLGQLRGAQKRKVPDRADNLDLDLVPDIKIVLPSVKARVFARVVIVFSGVFALGDEVERDEKTLLAKSFGAQVEEDVTKRTTHVVAARHRRTLKVKKALKRGKGRINIVNLQWFTDSIMSFEKKDEGFYLLDFQNFAQPVAVDDDDILSESESLPSETGDETDSNTNRTQSKPTHHLKRPSNADDTDNESMISGSGLPSELDIEEGSPIGGTNEDWSAINDELAEFLGSDGEEGEQSDDDGTVASEASTNIKLSVRGKKREREENDSDGESENGMGGKVKKKPAVGKGLTSLSQEINVKFDDGGGINSDAHDAKGDDDDDNGEHSGEEGDGWSEFGEEDLEEELEKAGGEDQAQGKG